LLQTSSPEQPCHTVCSTDLYVQHCHACDWRLLCTVLYGQHLISAGTWQATCEVGCTCVLPAVESLQSTCLYCCLYGSHPDRTSPDASVVHMCVAVHQDSCQLLHAGALIVYQCGMHRAVKSQCHGGHVLGLPSAGDTLGVQLLSSCAAGGVGWQTVPVF
jgi:hypothetical protein